MEIVQVLRTLVLEEHVNVAPMMLVPRAKYVNHQAAYVCICEWHPDTFGITLVIDIIIALKKKKISSYREAFLFSDHWYSGWKLLSSTDVCQNYIARWPRLSLEECFEFCESAESGYLALDFRKDNGRCSCCGSPPLRRRDPRHAIYIRTGKIRLLVLKYNLEYSNFNIHPNMYNTHYI